MHRSPSICPALATLVLAMRLTSLMANPLADDQKAQPEQPSAAVETKKKHPANRLAKEKSPYLLQHAHNPVDWFPWGDEAFEKAKKENKVVLLSIGYSTCHWCHVMERESFEDEEIGKLLKEKFVAIKLDREERPDIDAIYMQSMQVAGMGGGWPLNVFLTPDRKPFFGGTYFRKEQFRRLLVKLAETWERDRAALEKDATGLTEHVRQALEKEGAAVEDIKAEWIADAAKNFSAYFDPKYGGFSGAPKFPSPPVPQLVLLMGAKLGDKKMIDQVLFTCDRMAQGGIHDHIGGGFARYSVDEKWLVPHFEKMLYDNAQLLELYLNAHLISGEPRYAEVARGIISYLLRDMRHKDGGFYSAEDADSEGHEGKFYTWTRKELEAILTAEEAKFAIGYFGVTEAGNFEDHSHPQPLKNQNVLAVANPSEKLGEAEQALLKSVKAKLFQHRSKRIRPHLDDKILTSWNGLLLGPLARAGVILDMPEALEAAKQNVAFIREKLWDEKTSTLYHRHRDGERDSTQLLVAYAYWLNGLIDFYQCTLDSTALEWALAIAGTMIAKFYDEKQGGFFTSASSGDLLFKTKDSYDGAEPSGNSVAVLALHKLAEITGDPSFSQRAEQTLRLFGEKLQKQAEGVPLMLQAASFRGKAHHPYRAVIVGDIHSPEGQAMLKAAHSVYQPEKIVMTPSAITDPSDKNRTALDGKPTIYICTGQSCKLPTNDPAKVAGLLKVEAKKK